VEIPEPLAIPHIFHEKGTLIRVTGGLILGSMSILVSWALLFESSPFHQDALRPGWARWIWQIVNIPAVGAILISGTEASGIFVLFAQWFLIGYFIFSCWEWIRNQPTD